MDSLYIFGYGSLVNPKSRAQTVACEAVIEHVILRNYQRNFNAPVGNFLYLNLTPKEKQEVKGVVIKVNQKEYAKLKKREAGYRLINVTSNISCNIKAPVFTFIAPNKKYPDMKILKSYLNTCLAAIPASEHDQWLRETIINNEIIDDTKNPQYEFMSK